MKLQLDRVKETDRKWQTPDWCGCKKVSGIQENAHKARNKSKCCWCCLHVCALTSLWIWQWTQKDRRVAAMCVMVGEEREREGGQVRQAVSEHVYHWVRERKSERQTANGTEEETYSDLRQFSVEVWFHPTFFFQRDSWHSGQHYYYS